MHALFALLLSFSLLACHKDKESPHSGAPDDSNVESTPEDADGDGYDAGEDCDDSNADINPDATEVCDEVDNDCDDAVDEDAGTTWYTDADDDTFGDDASAVTACTQPEGTVAEGGDCDDGDPAYHPGASEIDCEDPNDYNCDGSVGYDDADDDGFAACMDCDDADNTEYPGGTEVCDGDDDDCDGEIDEAGAEGGSTYYWDGDEDGYGDPALSTTGCTAPDGYVENADDCDDERADVSPVSSELCDDVDNDCDGEIDEAGALDEATWYADTDLDGYGDPASTTAACDQPDGYVEYGTDCDDSDAAYNPAAIESCDDPNDYNCDGSVGYDDADSDGWAACEECDDADAAVNPDAIETCDSVDDDCDGQIDEDDAADASTWYADADLDTYGDADRSRAACSAPDGYVSDETDCDDTDNAVHPGADEVCDGQDDDCDGAVDDGALDASTWYADGDDDGYGDDSSTVASCDAPSGTVDVGGDCDDGDSAINPGADEVCDDVDNDCDGYVDDSALDTTTYYADSDADGYGDPDATADACALPTGYSADDLDCDDGDADINPDADELCDGVDDDCDGSVDEDDAIDASTWYADTDADGYGDADSTTTACAEPTGYSDDATDCDDSDVSINPGADEVCNTYDDDCDGSIDEAGTTALGTWYADADDDGYGDPSSTTEACYQPTGYVKLGTDCDDEDADVNPGAADVCNGVDDDCSGTIDDGSDGATWYADSDDDGYGDDGVTAVSCTAPTGYVDIGGDCDDATDSVNPGADELCNEVDDDCDGTADDSAVDAPTWYKDADKDGYGNKRSYRVQCDKPGLAWVEAENTDCNDANASINPGATEVCDGVDNDCDGSKDEDAADTSTWYADSDGDDYGDPDHTTTACDAPSGYTNDARDCDDGDGTINPSADEVCDGVDNDCDDSIDESAVDMSTWYVDSDTDGYGVTTRTKVACDQPSGYADNADDCDDTTSAVNPGASEICNGADDDCDGSTDEGTTGIVTWYEDGDSDDYGDPSSTTTACAAPTGYVADNTDCDDSTASVNPGATETCDSIDDDCDGSIDEAGATGGSTWYADADDDGYGDAGSTTTSCSAPTGYIADKTDCDDTDVSINPGATETCNGYDDDCDGSIDESGATSEGTWYKDADSDGYGDPSKTKSSCTKPTGYVKLSTDCDDTDASVNPAATEVCNSLDDDCDGTVDNGATDASTWYADSDSDGYGDASISTSSCDAPTGYGLDDTDCDDTDASINPGASELCNSVDDDCDGVVDDGATDRVTWYQDDDEDGYGRNSSTKKSCSAPAGYSSLGDDCDDGDDTVYPTAPEVCGDGQVNDCDATASAALADCDLSGSYNLNTTAWSKLEGVNAGDYAGFSVEGPGDLNGDGADDILVGAARDNTVKSYAGAAYLFRGPVTGELSLSDADAVFRGEGGGDEAAQAMSAMGDADGDGYLDVLITAPKADLDPSLQTGTTYLELGPFSGSYDLTDADARLTGELAGDVSGRSVSAAGDWDGDGTLDIAIGAAGDDTSGAWSGKAYIVLGPVSGTASLSAAEGEFNGESTYDYAGRWISGGSDVDGDGTPDLLVGANGDDDGGTTAGAAYLIYGPLTGSMSLALSDTKIIGEAAGDQIGRSLAIVGDTDGDGNPDLLLGALGSDRATTSNPGAAYLFHGVGSGVVSASTADTIFLGSSKTDQLGIGVDGAGDWDGDGSPDVVVGAQGVDSGATDGGAGYVFLSPYASGTIKSSKADVRLVSGDASGSAGFCVAGAGDVNADGRDDVLIGAYKDDTTGTDAGAAFLVGAGY